MIEIPRSESQARLDVFRFEIGHFFEDVCRREPGREQVEHITHANAHAADARPAAALLGIDSDPLRNLAHFTSIRAYAASGENSSRILVATADSGTVAAISLAMVRSWI